MFTGIVRELGRIESIEGGADGIRVRVRAPRSAGQAALGDSVALNGVCLTVVDVADGVLSFDAVPETISRTALGRLRPSGALNVEPALRAGEPFGGHIVQGHVDGLGRIRTVTPEGDGVRIEVEAPHAVLRYCVEKGSIAVDGVSLTVAALRESSFEVALIPHTLAVTTLASLEPGNQVNLEVDVLAKYVERLLPSRDSR